MADERLQAVCSVVSGQKCCCLQRQPTAAIKKINEALETMPPNPDKAKEAVHIIQNNDSIQWSDNKLKQCLIDGTCKIADVVKETENKPEDENGIRRQVMHHAGHTLKSDLTALKIIAENGSDDLDKKDKKEVAENLKNSLNHTKTITNSPSMISFLGECGCKLTSWVSEFSDWIVDFFNEAMKEEERKEKEKKCEERQEQKRKYYELNRQFEEAKKKERQLAQKIKLLNLKKSKEKDAVAALNLAEKKYKSEVAIADYFNSKKCEVACEMLPPSVCGKTNIELDIIC